MISRGLAFIIVAAWVFGFAARASTLTTLYNFTGTPDGQVPDTTVVYHDGYFYGATLWGGGEHCGSGSGGCGTIYKLNPVTGIETVIYTLKEPDGQRPGHLVYYDGKLYGTASQGGASYFGTVFEFDLATDKMRVLHNFRNASDGYRPAGLTLAGGMLYGIVPWGGANGDGLIFQIDPVTGHFSTVYQFGPIPDGRMPAGAMIYANNLLYGVTSQGGATGEGSIFQFNPATGAENVVYSFGPRPDGAVPTAPLVYEQGYLYGTTMQGGQHKYDQHGAGTAFRVDASAGAETVVHDFSKAQGAWPCGGLTFHSGKFFGVTQAGPGNPFGVIFSINALSGHEVIVYPFDRSGGDYTCGPLYFLSGAFYGVTEQGGPNDLGTFFKLTP